MRGLRYAVHCAVVERSNGMGRNGKRWWRCGGREAMELREENAKKKRQDATV